MNYIYSTLSNPQTVPVYTAYPGAKEGSSDPSIKERVIYINGGANVIDHAFQTPKGVCTIVSDDDLKELEKSHSFKKWQSNGFITVEKTKADADDVAKDLTAKDKSAQITDGDHEKRFKGGDTTADVNAAPAKKRSRK
tara:strand:- start:529 stop:942 length:414 start_codon:yes stop_codon:yes gene_type:complete